MKINLTSIWEAGLPRIDLSDIDRAIYLQARAFQSGKQSNKEDGFGGWGQFLDINPARTQIGTYGTSSGTIVLDNASGPDAVLTDVKNFLRDIWMREETTQNKAGRRFSQNLKLFVFYLAISKLQDQEFEALQEEMKFEIKKRQLPNGLWGDWWIDEDDHDPVEKVFPSSIALLCLAHSGTPLEFDVSASLERLTSLVSYTKDIPPAFLAAAISALAHYPDINLHPNIYDSAKDLVWSDPPEVNEESLYIYEYKHLDSAGGKVWKTEIFSFPHALLLGLAALRFRDELVFSVFCRNTAERLLKLVIDHDGMLPSDAEMRTHCMPQMWCSLFLVRYREQLFSPNWIQRFMFNVMSPQSRSFFWYKLLPVFAMPSLAIANVMVPDQETGWRVLVSFSTVLVAGVWGPDVIRRWLPGGH